MGAGDCMSETAAQAGRCEQQSGVAAAGAAEGENFVCEEVQIVENGAVSGSGQDSDIERT